MSKHKDLLSRVTARVGAARAAHVLSAPRISEDAPRSGVRAARTSSWAAGSGWTGPPASAPPDARQGPRISWADGGAGLGLVPTVSSSPLPTLPGTPHTPHTPGTPASPPPLRASMSMPIRRRPSMNVALAAAAAAAVAHMTTPTPPPAESSGGAGQAPAGAAAATPSPAQGGGGAAAPGSLSRRPSLTGILASGGHGLPRKSSTFSGMGSGGGPTSLPHYSVSVPSASSAFSRDSDSDRQLLVAFMLHCADLCTPLLPPPLSARATEALGREFAAQASAERAAGLPVTVMLADDRASKAKLELGFIDYAVRAPH